MKVLHVTNAYPTDADPGAGVFIKSQVESLRNAGLEVDVCVLEGTGIGKYLRGLRQLRAQATCGGYDVIHAHYMYTGWVARLSCRRPLVVSYMGSDVLGTTTHSGRRRLLSFVLHLVGANLLALVASHVIVKSRQLRSLLLTRRQSLVPNGVDLDLFRPMDPVPTIARLSHDKRYVLFAGKPSNPRKRFWLAQHVMRLVQSALPDAELVWLERETPRQVALFLNAVDCLLLTSTHEGSPNILKEALACNLPVVSVDVGDAAERIAGVDNCQVVAAGEPPQLAAAVLGVLHSRRRSANGREAVAHLAITAVAQTIIGVYARCVRPSPRVTGHG